MNKKGLFSMTGRQRIAMCVLIVVLLAIVGLRISLTTADTSDVGDSVALERFREEVRKADVDTTQARKGGKKNKRTVKKQPHDNMRDTIAAF